MSAVNCGGSPTEFTALATGVTGATGAQGGFGGFSLEWNFDTGVTATPGTGDLRFDDATLASVANIYVSETDANSNSVESFFTAITNSNDYGYIKVFKKSDQTVFLAGEVTATTDNGTDWTIAITNRVSSGTFTNNDAVVLTFAPSGTDGVNFTCIYDEDTLYAVENIGNPSVVTPELQLNGDEYDFTSDLSIFKANGDELLIEILGTFTSSAYLPNTFELFIGQNTGAKTLMKVELQNTGTSQFKIISRVKRVSASVVRVDNFVYYWKEQYGFPLVEPLNDFKASQGTVTALDLQADTNPYGTDRKILYKVDAAALVTDINTFSFSVKEINKPS